MPVGIFFNNCQVKIGLSIVDFVGICTIQTLLTKKDALNCAG